MLEHNLSTPQQLAPDDQILNLQFDFNGEWLPDVDPLKITNGNFSDIQNIRFTKWGLVPVNGYTKVNTNAITTYIKARDGFQLRTPHTQKSYIFTQQLDTNLANGRVFVNKGAPPAVSNFEASPIHTDASGASQGYFDEAPENNMIYCNGVESLIYAGEESTISAFFKVTSITGLTPVAPIEYTKQLRNTLQTSDNVATVTVYLVGANRPLKGIKPYISSGNASTSTVDADYWDGDSWENVSNLVDNTIASGKTHAATGTILWDSTVNTAKPALINNLLLYWYKITLSAGSCVMYHVTYNADIQPLLDLWDGVNRTCISCQISRSSVYEDYTAEIYASSSIQYPIAAKFAGILSTDHAIFIFDERTTAVKFSFLAGLVNTTAATVTIYYWNGSAWTTVGTVYDGTLDSAGGTKSMGQSGMMYWNPPDITVEHSVDLFGVKGFAYKFSWSATLTASAGTPPASGCYADTIFGIPAVRKMGAYKFSFTYRNRCFLVGDVAGKEPHGIDFGNIDTADSYSGAQASGLKKRLYIGKNSSGVVAAANVFNRFGSNVYNSEILIKPTETYILDGDSPDNFKVSQISDNIGISGVRTLCTAEVAFEITKDAVRNIALWVSNVGPILFDAAVVVPLRGVDLYFDKSKTTCVNTDAMDKAHSWFDPNYYEWHICLPSGAGQTTCNVWLIYNLLEKKWSKNNVGSQYIPQGTVKVIDDYGNVYYYGLLDNGTMVRLENGVLWNETDTIQSYITTNAMLPTGKIFDSTKISLVKYIIEGNSNYVVDFTGSDVSIIGSGFEDGNLDLYGEIIENDSVTESIFIDDDFICKELIEGVTFGSGIKYQDTDGVFRISGVATDGLTMTINTVAGNFITEGFATDLLVYTNDINNPGPFLCSGVTANALSFNTGKATKTIAGNPITLISYYIKVEYYNNGNVTLIPIIFNKVTSANDFVKFVSTCGYVALSHKFKFIFYSSSLVNVIKPLAWGIQYSLEHSDI